MKGNSTSFRPEWPPALSNKTKGHHSTSSWEQLIQTHCQCCLVCQSVQSKMRLIFANIPMPIQVSLITTTIKRTVPRCGVLIPTISGTTDLAITKKTSSARARPLRTETPIAQIVAMPQIHPECVSDHSHLLGEFPEIYPKLAQKFSLALWYPL